MSTGTTKVAHITTKQDMSRWTRAHADAPGITWSVFPGPGAADGSADVRRAATAGPAGNAAVRRASA